MKRARKSGFHGYNPEASASPAATDSTEASPSGSPVTKSPRRDRSRSCDSSQAAFDFLEFDQTFALDRSEDLFLSMVGGKKGGNAPKTSGYATKAYPCYHGPCYHGGHFYDVYTGSDLEWGNQRGFDNYRACFLYCGPIDNLTRCVGLGLHSSHYRVHNSDNCERWSSNNLWWNWRRWSLHDFPTTSPSTTWTRH
jgi:hypothetical protein